MKTVKNAVMTTLQNNKKLQRAMIEYMKMIFMVIVMIIKATIMMGTITLDIIIIMNTKVSQWRQQYCMHYVILKNNLADVIQSIGLIISSLIIFFAGSDKGK